MPLFRLIFVVLVVAMTGCASNSYTFEEAKNIAKETYDDSNKLEAVRAELYKAPKGKFTVTQMTQIEFAQKHDYFKSPAQNCLLVNVLIANGNKSINWQFGSVITTSVDDIEYPNVNVATYLCTHDTYQTIELVGEADGKKINESRHPKLPKRII